MELLILLVAVAGHGEVKHELQPGAGTYIPDFTWSSGIVSVPGSRVHIHVADIYGNLRSKEQKGIA